MNDTTPLPGDRTPLPDDRMVRHARTGPMLWGAVFLVVCAWAAQQALFPGWLPSGVWIAVVVLGLGLLLLILGIGAALGGNRNRG